LGLPIKSGAAVLRGHPVPGLRPPGIGVGKVQRPQASARVPNPHDSFAFCAR